MRRTASMFPCCESMLGSSLMVGFQKPIAERDHAHDLQALHREGGGGMAADLQGQPGLPVRVFGANGHVDFVT